MGRWIELVLDLEINTGAIVKEEDGVGPSPPFKKMHNDQGGKYGCSFYGQDSGRFVPFFDSGLFIHKGVSLFIQGWVEGRS